jgi:SagB-type dehydrogenase family enzyme
MARTRARAPGVAVRVLELCSRPQTVKALQRRLREFRPADVARLVEQLAAHGMLLPARGRGGRKPAVGWDAWNPAAGLFHFSTKDVRFPRTPADARRIWETYGPRSRMPAPVKRYPGATRITLPDPRQDGEFARTLQARRTWREFSAKPLDLDRLATLLHLTWGVQRWGTVDGQGRIPLKTSPSGGSRHPGEVYVLARRVTGLAPGYYHYEAGGRVLERLPGRLNGREISTFLPGQPWFRRAPVLLLMTAVFAREQWRYGFPRAYRAVLIEAGHLCQTCCLVATWLGLAPFCSMAFPDSTVERALGLDGVSESVIYIAGVGVPPRHGWQPYRPNGRSPRE